MILLTKMNFKKKTISNLITQSTVSRLITIVVIGLMFTVQNGHSQVFESLNTIPENVTNDVSLYNLTLVLPNFSYTLTGNSANSSNMFSIDSTGSIILARNLPETTRKLFDFEKFPVFEVYLTATNRDNIADVRSVTVRLRLSDVNDEGPVFVNQPFPYLAVVSPSASSGTIVYTLTVNDPDTVPSPKPAPQFVILTQIPIVRFKLSTDADVNKINIITTENAVFPQGVEITINVQVQDDAGNKNTADVKVLVGPRPPQFFSTAYTGQIYETNTPSFIQGKDRQQLEIKALQFQTGQSLQFKLADLSSSSSYSNFYTLDVVQSLSNTNVQTIKLKNGPAIDYETVKTMSVNVIAVDPVSQQTSTVPLSIEVLDENDNSPVFAVVQYYKVVPENLKVGDTVLTVTASDKDSGQNGVLEFATLSPNFYINTTLEGANYVGTVRVKSLLDYDKNPGAQYLFNVTATDKGNIPRTATVSVIVSVTNVNDNPPIIDTATSTYNLLETAQPNVVVAIIQSSDIDGDGVKFYFSGKIPTYEIFKIDEQSGIISLSATIPKEINSYYLPVIAVDDGKCCGPSSQSLTSSANFTVNIIDINSHKPTFSACNTYDNLASVKELSPIGTPVFKVSAVDPDRGENGRVIYQISSPNPTQANAPFEINSSNGSITVKNNFTRGSDGYIQVTVVGSNPPPTVMEGWCTFRVTIIDVNDHAPVFSQAQYTAQISISMPKNSTIIQMLATDADVGVNANLTYTFQNPSTMFSIDSLTGVVRLIGNLNGQNETFYTMVVIANDNGKDPGPKTGSTTLTINIDLEGRTPPQFIQLPPSLIFSISESAPAGTNLVTLSCNSSIAQKPEVEFQVLDTETSSESKAFGYIQIPGSNPPQMNLTLKINANLDYLTKKQYKLSIFCLTLYGITLRTFINPIVDITDANNQVPVFEGLDSTGRYAGTVAENTEAGATVIQVSASDKDEVLQYRTVTFQLLDNLDNFTIRSDGDNRATVLTRVKFDREKQEYYTVAIQAQDGANAANSDKPNTALRYINVKITDVNDNPPSFANTTYSYTVLESAEVNTRVGSVTANDPDSIDNGNLNYRFTADTNINNAFSILAGTGEIRVARKLDYESDTEPKTYNLSLIAIDSNQLHNASTTVLISVIDVNDNDPVFLQNSYEVNGVVTEEDTSVTPQNPKFLVQVHATDKDKSRPETDIRYYLMGSNTNFIVNSTSGDVYLTGPLDRDVDNPVYTFTVRAEDERVNPRLGYANVFITPMDINDNSPVFDPAFLRGNVTENLARGNFCLSVLARDKDFGENGTVKYQISNSQPSPSRASLFRIIDTSGSGLIFAIGRPDQYDHETDKLMYLSVEAYDQGRPSQKTTTATVTIYITDDNDQSPYFEQALYTTQMSEAFTSGSVLLVPAIDLDDDPRNKDLRFKLIGAPGDNFFFVSTLDQKANIQVFKPVDYETNDHVFNMTLTVEDGAEGHKNSTQVQIFITDYNDNDPVITPSFKEVLMLEERPAGTVVFKFNATDKDEGLNGQFDFTIRRSTDPRYEFYIHPQTGEVKTRKPVDREEGDTRNIIVVATDKGETPRSGSATLIVKLTDINDNAPSFKDNYTPVLDENQPFDNRLVVEIFGKDPDTLENGPPFGFKLPDNCNVPACQYFTLTYNSAGDSNRGTATVRTKVVTFDREQAKTYLLPIVMWDRKDKTTGDPSMTTTNTLTITIGDQNDNDQKPGHQNIYVYNYEGQFADVEIGRVYVEDPDDWDLPDKTFSNLRPATMQNYFSVAPDSGMITIKKNVPVGTYELQVSVYDKKYLSTVTGTVSVMVSQLSDEAVMKSGSIRLNDMTAEQFVKPSGSGTTATSTFDKFRTQLASLLGYSSPDNIDIVSLTDGKGFLDVHYSAHGSPYSNPSQIESAIMLNQNQFEQNVGVKIVQVPVNLCMDEVYDDGCYTDLGFTGTPLLVNSNGSSYVMTRTSMSAKAGCVDSIFPEPEQCRGDYCFNGGTCVLDDWKKLSCNCLPGFDGPRCQQRRHSFDGSSIAFYDTLSVCSEGRTSIEFITTQEAGVIMYTGPLLSTSQDSKDYMTLTLSAGLPTLKLNLGTDELSLSLPSNADKVNDGKWHHIDIDRDNQNVVLTLDRCEKASSSANGTVADWSPCRITGTVPGPDVLLNVQSFLQLGGQYKSTTAAGFNGCLRNLVHNTKLYDLSFKLPNWKSGTNGCPTEETVCAESSAKPVCGVNAACDSVWSPSIQINKCRCAPGWYGDNCAKDAPVVDLKQNSYLKWQASAAVIELTVRKMSFQMMFRTRKTVGSLFMLTNAAQNQINLKLTNGRLTLVYNMGMGEKILALTNATVNNGQWHTIRMERYGTEFLLSLDGGEGRNYNYQVAIPNLSVFFKMLSFFSVGGSIQPVATAPSSIPDDLFSTCVRDIRLSDIWLPLSKAQNTESVSGLSLYDVNNVVDGCTRDDCGQVTCAPNQVCFPLWEKYECRCAPGFILDGVTCVSLCQNNPCLNGGTCTIVNNQVSCACPSGWTGNLCGAMAIVDESGLSGGAIAGIVIGCLLLLILVILLLLFLLCRRRTDEKEKFVLEVDPDDDYIRENVMFYDEEGAGEEDHDAYDLTLLQKPHVETSALPKYPDKTDEMSRRNAPRQNAQPHLDRPDVGSFIDHRIKDAEDDDPFADSTREYNHEGSNSDAGSLSSLNTSSSDASQDYDYLSGWGPKFAKLADMYGAGQNFDENH